MNIYATSVSTVGLSWMVFTMESVLFFQLNYPRTNFNINVRIHAS